MKITFVTWHNWETRRIGGFHRFAEATAKAGNEVCFFSFERPYSIYFLHEDRLNGKVLKKLIKGVKYELGDGASLTNCTWPTLAIPHPFDKLLPSSIVCKLKTMSLMPFRKFCDRFLKGTECFVLESVGIDIFEMLKHEFPDAKFVYRPSDPLMIHTATQAIVRAETNILLKSDKVLIVNQAGLELYKSRVPDFDKRVNYEILSNGVDAGAFKLKYECPTELQKDNTALYVGGYPPNWKLIFYAADSLKDTNFIIVCPATPSKEVLKKLPRHKNVTFINGIPGSKVPEWVTNANLIIVPYPENMYKIRPWGVTAKCYQAMTACKPIVAYHDTEELASYGAHTTYTFEDFVKAVAAHIGDGETSYSFDSERMDWSVKTNRFLDSINELFK